jgi:hypothetical protein
MSKCSGKEKISGGTKQNLREGRGKEKKRIEKRNNERKMKDK